MRGELIIKRNVFEKKYGKSFSNPRNFVSGVVNSKTLDNIQMIKDIDFVVYELLDDGMMNPLENLEKLENSGFDLVPYQVIEGLSLEFLTEELHSQKMSSNYDIDGLVVQGTVPYFCNKKDNPSYSFAFKLGIVEDEKVSSVVEKVEWNVSRHSVLKPTIHISPKECGGVIVKKLTGFNAKFIQDSGIGKGTSIKFVRSGDVIPFITDVITKKSPDFPNRKYKWNESKVDILVDDDSGEEEIKVGQITHFFKTLKIKNIDEKTVKKLYDCGYK